MHTHTCTLNMRIKSTLGKKHFDGHLLAMECMQALPFERLTALPLHPPQIHPNTQ
jgi:hypothetical protein